MAGAKEKQQSLSRRDNSVAAAREKFILRVGPSHEIFGVSTCFIQKVNVDCQSLPLFNGSCDVVDL